jgi:mannitol/fructose-specific phosphotransferase system IIA component (Ntr-type)
MIQGIHKHIKESTILLNLDDYIEMPEEFEDLSTRRKKDFKKSILKVLVGLFDTTGNIVNPSKCLTDLENRELKATTGMGKNVAIPHVRTLQARDFTIAIMRSDKGVYFNSLDGELVNYFMGVVCPPYQDKKYLNFLSILSSMIVEGELQNIISSAQSPNDILGDICRYR